MGEPAKKAEVPAVKPTSVSTSLTRSDEVELFDLKGDKIDFGRADTLRFNILTWVLDEKYDKAITELKTFLDEPSEYPDFHRRILRYINHSIDLIYAIKAKRNFPGINSLTRAKQQELREKFREHFRELQQVLKKTEKIETDLRITDARSTIHVVRALWFSVVAIIALAFILEFTGGLGKTSFVVAEDVSSQVTNWLLNLVGL